MNDKSKQIWVYFDSETLLNIENFRGMLCKAHQLKDLLSDDILIVAFGILSLSHCNIEDICSYGADLVLVNESPIPPNGELYSKIACKMIKEYEPIMAMFPYSGIGKEVAARVSIKLESGLTADCIDIEPTGGSDFIFLRAAISSSVIAQIKCRKSFTQLCTIKENMFNSLLRTFPSSMNIRYYNNPFSMEPISIRIKSEQGNDNSNSVDFSSAKVVFSAGRALQKKEDLDLFIEIAKKIGAEYGGTRALVEAGLIPKSRQLGQSGRSIAPPVYVAFGISGATQHIAGIKESKTIIAINNDPDAPIFRYANYAIIADAIGILNELSSMLNK